MFRYASHSSQNQNTPNLLLNLDIEYPQLGHSHLDDIRAISRHLQAGQSITYYTPANLLDVGSNLSYSDPSKGILFSQYGHTTNFLYVLRLFQLYTYYS